MGENLLTALAVKNAKPDADKDKVVRFGDGGGLALLVKGPSRKWVYRFTHKGRVKEMGLGPANEVTLADARQARDAARKLVRAGVNPIEAKKADRKKHRTFGEFADDFIVAMEGSWRNEKHRTQWWQTFGGIDPRIGGPAVVHRPYAAALRSTPVNEVDTTAVLRVLKPLWKEVPETAGRVRSRIEAVLDAAKASGHRTDENPARWKGHLEHLLPKRDAASRGHHAAMEYEQIAGFMRQLCERDATAARALEFTILTVARAGEALGARWSEIDRDKKVWTVPAARMKKKREHRVPLSSAAMAVIDHMEIGRRSEFVFPGQTRGKPLSATTMMLILQRMRITGATVHGFRSTFRDWAGNETNVPREIAEAALSHAVGDATERAYRRGDAFDKRRVLMDQWAEFCRGTGAETTGVVVQMFEERDHVQAA